MAFAAKRYFQGQLSATVTTTLYTNPGSVKSIITMLHLVNTDTVARLVTITGPGTAAGSEILKTYSMQPGEVLTLRGHWVLNSAEVLAGGADVANKVSAHITGAEG